MTLLGLHHVAVICSDYSVSKQFYTEVLGLNILSEVYRAERDSYKLDLEIPGGTQIELFSFPASPNRLTYPEAGGLRHLAFLVSDLDQQVSELVAKGVSVEEIRTDEITGKRYTFFADPDGLPIELYAL